MTEILARSRCSRVGVVIGADAAIVARAVPSDLAHVIVNRGWDEGIASSIRSAVGWAITERADALLIVLCDQPALHTSHIDGLFSAFETGADVVCSLYDGRRSVPALFGSRWFGRLEDLRGDTGAGPLRRDAPSVVEVPWPEGALDLDTEDDLATWIDRASTGAARL
jgi:molybdenum cofactor cytidylyltransferase